MKASPILFAALLALSACGRGDGDVNVTVHQDSTSATPPAADPIPAPEPSAPAPPDTSVPAPPPAPSSRVVSAQGFGPVPIGMAAAEAQRALSPIERYGDGTEACRYLNPKGAPAGVQYMVNEGVIARYDVGPLDGPKEVAPSELPRTAEGIGVGSTTAQVAAAYGARITREPHHYVKGEYLTVTPADTPIAAHRLRDRRDGQGDEDPRRADARGDVDRRVLVSGRQRASVSAV